MSKNPLDPNVKAAWIGAIALILAAIIGGVFGVIKLTSASPSITTTQTQTSTVQQPSTPTPTVTPTPDYVTPFPSSPPYAHVSIALHSGSPIASNGETLIGLDFRNTGTNDCTDIKFSAVNLISLDGNKIKPSSPIDKSWKLLASGVPVQRNVTFPIAVVKGAQYNLTIHLDVGGCAVPHDHSSNRFADYQLPITG